MPGKTSFTDKLQAATTRLELGLGGHALSDTLLFGAKVMSTPGVLTPKNISDIESNRVDGKTTWRHQNAYVKMVIAGCINQARHILEKFDEILYGDSPEELVVKTHVAVRELLASQECQVFLRQKDQIGNATEDKKALAAGDNFIRKITEAVAPILPITLRNKALDGGYFRTALQLMAAAEFIFSQYEADVRSRANPAGVVGMCNNMHAEIKRTAIYNDDLKPLGEFINHIKTQYQTSLGLGSPFPRDPSIQGYRRGRKARGRSYLRSPRYQGLGFSRGRGISHQGTAAYPSGQGTDMIGQWSNTAVPIRGPGVCYDYQAGTCKRGRACKFFH